MNHCMSGTHLKALFSQKQFMKDYFRYFQVKKKEKRKKHYQLFINVNVSI